MPVTGTDVSDNLICYIAESYLTHNPRSLLNYDLKLSAYGPMYFIARWEQ